MSRNELRIIARIVLIGVGLYILLQIFLMTLLSVAMLPILSHDEAKRMPAIIAPIGIYVLAALASVYLLVRCVNRISERIVESEPADDTQVSWVTAAFRLLCVGVGILTFFWSAQGLAMALSMYIRLEEGQHYYAPWKGEIIKNVVMIALSLYFALGAPGFVRWQVRRTMKQCGGEQKW